MTEPKLNLVSTANTIFVFGSNLSGIHGAGAARFAHHQLGAMWGVGEGLTGACYALPTKSWGITYMPLDMIQMHVDRFLTCARDTWPRKYKVTQVGCGLAGNDPAVMAEMFRGAPSNCLFDTAWAKYLKAEVSYWGTA